MRLALFSAAAIAALALSIPASANEAKTCHGQRLPESVMLIGFNCANPLIDKYLEQHPGYEVAHQDATRFEGNHPTAWVITLKRTKVAKAN